MADHTEISQHRAVLGPIYRHLWLTQSVAASVGVDLSAALHGKALDARSYSEVITRCRSAGCDHICSAHLSGLRKGRQDKVQDFCPNKAVIEQL